MASLAAESLGAAVPAVLEPKAITTLTQTIISDIRGSKRLSAFALQDSVKVAEALLDTGSFYDDAPKAFLVTVVPHLVVAVLGEAPLRSTYSRSRTDREMVIEELLKVVVRLALATCIDVEQEALLLGPLEQILQPNWAFYKGGIDIYTNQWKNNGCAHVQKECQEIMNTPVADAAGEGQTGFELILRRLLAERWIGSPNAGAVLGIFQASTAAGFLEPDVRKQVADQVRTSKQTNAGNQTQEAWCVCVRVYGCGVCVPAVVPAAVAFPSRRDIVGAPSLPRAARLDYSRRHLSSMLSVNRPNELWMDIIERPCGVLSFGMYSFSTPSRLGCLDLKRDLPSRIAHADPRERAPSRRHARSHAYIG
jgi:hypothetical protein